MKKYRNEWKYICTNFDLNLLSQRLASVLEVDSNANENGMYYIHSLYFDDYKNTCARQNDSGYYKRFKWRIRYYNDFEGTFKLEKKEKLCGRCHKKSCLLTLSEYEKIMDNDISDLIYTTDKKLLIEFCKDILIKYFRPKVIIDYERKAFIEPILNIRITFDTSITSSCDFDNFLSGNYIKNPIQDKNLQVLEVKFDDILPGYIKNIIYSGNFGRTTFSKYYLGRKKVEEFW